MKTLVSLLLLALCMPALFAQKETNNWIISYNAGITFATGSPQLIPGVLNGGTYNASYSDANGNFKFVFTGYQVYDRNYNLMPGSNLFPFNQQASYHIALTVASPANANQFYIFYTTSSATNQYSLRYAIVDLSLNGGLGQVISADNVIENGISLAYTLVQKKGSAEFWVVTHVLYTNTFHSRLVNTAGIASTPVTSQAGSALNKTDYNFLDMRTSPNGEMIAGITNKTIPGLFSLDSRFVEVFNIDGQTGIITEKVRSITSRYTYQSPDYLEFSPDNRLLYADCAWYAPGLQPCGNYASTSIYQYNLCYTDSITFSRYAPVIAYTFNPCTLLHLSKPRLAPNKKIYMRFGSVPIPAIESPNVIGTHCDMNYNAFNIPVTNHVMMPDFYHAYLQKAVINNIVYTGGCYPNPLHFKITNDTINHVEWNFGDPASGGNNTSINKEEDHVFSAPGFYTVNAKLYASDGSFIETVTTLVEIKDPTKRLLYDYPKDTIFCQGQSLKMQLDVVNGVFAWYTQRSDGSWNYNTTSDSFRITSSGNYMVEMRQNDCNGCRMVDSIKVTVLPSPTFNLGADTYICTGDSLLLIPGTPGADFLWSTGAITDRIYVKNAGKYWVRAEYNHNGCPVSDTINITQRPGVVFSLPNDTTLCNNQTLLLNPGVPNAGYYWNTGSTSTTYTVTGPGKYWVTIYGANSCWRADTIKVNYVNAQSVYLGRDTTLCMGDSVKLTANVPTGNYLWSTGATDPGVTIKNSGQYWVKVDNSSCTVTDTINIAFNPIPFFSLGNDTTICDKDKLILSSGFSNAAYLWQDGTKNNQLTASTAGLYWGQVTQQGCSYRDTLVLSTKPIPSVFLGNDTTLCDNKTLLLQAGSSKISNYLWNDNTTADNHLVNTQGTYWVKVTGLNGCTNADTINVYTKPLPVFTLGNDTTLCDQQQLAYNFSLPAATYTWNTGSTLAQQVITQPGLYWLEVNQKGCSKRDSVTVLYNSLPTVSVGNDTTLCEGISYQLNAIAPVNATYTWQNNSTAPSLTVNTAGKYWVRVLLNGCTNTDTVNIAYKLKPVFDLGNDTNICRGQTLILQPNIKGTASYQWQNGSTSPFITVSEPGTYEVTVANECGTKSDKITVQQGLCLLVLPNAFSPNHDGVNDVFRIKFPWFIKEYHMMIFNRWGQMVFESRDPYKGWDGNFNDAPQPNGGYVWLISLTDKDGQKDSSRGIVVLTR